MQLKQLAIFLIAFSSCARPQVTICVLDNNNQALQCADPEGQKFTLPMSQADNYVCISPDDTKQLLDWVKARCSK